MGKYVLKRIGMMVFVLLGVLLFVFIISRASGDPIPSILGADYTQEEYDEMYKELGFDKPYIVQFFNYVYGVVTRLDFGTSYITGRPVKDEVFSRFPISIRLAFNALIWAAPLGILIGMISATKQNTSLDYIVRTLSMIFASLPGFWVALMLMLIFSLELKLVPATGLRGWTSYILPAITMGLHPVANIARMSRSSMLEVIRQDYIRTARSKGLSQRQVIFGHALQNASVPIITQIGSLICTTIGGSAVIESIFGIPGMGSFLIFSITSCDYPSVQGTVLIYSAVVCVANFIIDLIYGFVDPRIKARYTTGKGSIRKMNKIIAAGKEN